MTDADKDALSAILDRISLFDLITAINEKFAADKTELPGSPSWDLTLNMYETLRGPDKRRRGRDLHAIYCAGPFNRPFLT